MEESRDKGKPPDAALSATMKKFVQLAENERRSGRKIFSKGESTPNLLTYSEYYGSVHVVSAAGTRPAGRRGLLAREATKLFAHVANVLHTVGVKTQSSLGSDYAAILKALVSEPEYRVAARMRDWEAIMEAHLNFLGSEDRPTPDDVHRVLGALGTLLSNLPGDLTHDMQVQLIEYFRVLGKDLEESTAAAARYGSDAFTAVTAFLHACGRDVATLCPTIHSALHQPALRMLREERVPKGKERAIGYLRAQLQLGGVTSEQLGDLQRWAQAEINTAQW